MKKGWIVISCAFAVTLALILTTYMFRDGRSDISRADYAPLLRLQAAEDAPEAKPLPENKDAGYRDKSFATGIDASPSLSVG
jgi:hypothetical protein